MSVIQAGNTTTTSLIYTGDTTGNLVFTTGGSNTTALTLANNQAATFAGALATALQGITSGSLPAGTVLQVVQGSTSATTATSSSSYIASGLSGTITPKFSTSKIFVILSSGVRSPSLSWLNVALFKNGSQLVRISDGLHYRISGSSDVTTQLNYSYLDSPATTSATTYALYFAVQGGGTGSINPDGNPMTIILMEVAA